MVGKDILWGCEATWPQQVTMLRTYAAWVEGAVDSDVEAIERKPGIWKLAGVAGLFGPRTGLTHSEPATVR